MIITIIVIITVLVRIEMIIVSLSMEEEMDHIVFWCEFDYLS